jgi:hypothetical protein
MPLIILILKIKVHVHIKAFLILFFLFQVTVQPSFSQTDTPRLIFDAVIRERVELWDGMNANNYGDDSPDAIGSLYDRILYQRIVAGFVYNPFASATIAMHLQDSRAFGWSLKNSEYPDLFRVKARDTEEPFYTLNPNEEFFEIYDLYIECRNIFDRLSMKLGRQKISYGDNRIFGPGEWGNTGRWTWDALKVSYASGENFVDAFIGGTKIHDPVNISLPFLGTEYYGGGIYSHYRIKRIFTAEPFYALKLQGSADYIRSLDITRHWTGIRLFNNDLNHFVLDFTYAREFGNENGKSVSAYGIVARAGYQFHTLPAKPVLCIRENYASGGTNDESRIRTFDPAYGSRDQYYGRMNITSWSNLDDREIVLYLFPVTGMKLEFNYHRFRIPKPEDVILNGTLKLQTGKYHLGDEFNVFADYNLNPNLKLTGAIGWFLPADVEPVNGQPVSNAAWASFQFSFSFDGIQIR